MAAIGNSPTQQAFTPAIDYFSGNGSTTAFTLSRPVASVAQVQVTIDNVAQNPSSAYTVSSNTITFTSAPLSGTNNIYVYYTSPITQVIAPGQGTVNTTALGNITNIASGNSSLTLQTGSSPTTAITIDTSQNVGIGATPATSLFAGTNINIGSSSYLQGTTNTYGLIIANNILLNGSTSWRYINSAAGTQYSQQAGVHYWYNTPSGTAGNAATLTQAMTLDNSGNFLVKKTAFSASADNNVGAQLAATGKCIFEVSGDRALILNRLNDNGIIQEFFRGAGNQVGNINAATSSVAYNTSSDYRLKKDIAPMTGALAKVSQLKPVTYKWKVDGEEGQGFIAHELQEVVPDCVTGAKDAVDADGNPSYQGIDTSFLVATLTAAIQELSAKNDALTARIEALENR
jgi:hypothetical protein